MKRVSAALGAAVLAFCGTTFSGITGAIAQNQMGPTSSDPVSNPTNVVRNFSVQTVGPVLNELGMPWQVQQLDNGAQYLTASGQSLNFILYFTACQEATGCVGMQTFAYFTDVSGNPQTVQAFNARMPFVTTGVDQNGTVYISRYDIADYGIPRGNIASSVLNFLAATQMFAQELVAAHQTVSLDGYASDLSAKHLNRMAAEKLTGQPAERPHLQGPERHQAGFEEGAQMIELLLQHDTTARNTLEKKVQNEID